jgi:Methyltransferase domain
MNYTDIQGWFDFQAVYNEAVLAHPQGVYVEVGAWKGKSTAYLASLTKTRPIRLFVVDTWRGSGGRDAASDCYTDPLLAEYGGDVFDCFLANMQSCGVLESLVPLRMRSAQAVGLFPDESVDFCFLDAAHDYDSVLADLNAWYPKVKRGGTIAGHDFTAAWPGVVRATKEFFASKGILVQVGNSWRHGKSWHRAGHAHHQEV